MTLLDVFRNWHERRRAAFCRSIDVCGLSRLQEKVLTVLIISENKDHMRYQKCVEECGKKIGVETNLARRGLERKHLLTYADAHVMLTESGKELAEDIGVAAGRGWRRSPFER